MMKKVKYKIKKLKVHLDDRGWLVELLKADQIEKPVKQIHISSINPGYVRGNHYHLKRMEWFFVIAGETELGLEDIKTKKKVRFKLSSKNPRVITIFPRVAHAVKNIGQGMAYFVSAQSDIFNPKKSDRILYKIL
ncbi:MAG: WxcM-like domain-containing protein [bacterium]